MKKISIMIFLLLILSIFTLNAEINLIIFPKEPIDMSLSSNPETAISRISSPTLNSASDYIADAKISIGEDIPLFALSFLLNNAEKYLPRAEMLRITVLAGGLINLHNNKFTDYLLHGKVFFSSPAFDYKYNPYSDEEGNGLLFSVGYTGIGTNFDEELLLNSPTEAMDENYINMNMYIIARADWTKQFLILKFGYNKPFECDAKEYSDLLISMNIPISKNGNLLYASLYTRLADNFYKTAFQVGFVIPGEIFNRKLIPYMELSNNEMNLGMKVNF